MAVGTQFLYDDAKVAALLKRQQDHAWDMEKEIPWQQGIDLNRPLVALDEQAFFFPNSSQEERLVISQMMGLIIAASIYEMEESLIHLKKECFDRPMEKYPVGPEFIQLGEQFFEEERKHSACFRRYIELYAQKLNIDPNDLYQILPIVRDSHEESFFKYHLKLGGQSFWWLVAIVEQEFLQIYRNIAPFKDQLEPLYFDLHQKHFEEEARHAPFPYYLIDLIHERSKNPFKKILNKTDLGLGQFIQSVWAVRSLSKLKNVQKLKGKGEFFDILAKLYPQLQDQSSPLLLWKLFTKTPYVSTLIHPQGQKKILKFAQKRGIWSIPFPALEEEELIGA